MSVTYPEKIGEPEVLAKSFGRMLRVQKYRHPDGEVREYSHWHAEGYASIVLPITRGGEVVAQWEFRYGAGQPILEVSGGTIKPGQTLKDVARAELRQETGYVPGELILLNGEMFSDPASLTYRQALWLAKDCNLVGKQDLDYGEYIETCLFPLEEWLEMIWSAKIKDQKTVAVTMLALPHLAYLGLKVRHA